MNTGGLRLDQAPPLAVPAVFFSVAPVALGALGVLLAADSAAVLTTAWAPRAIAATHLVTLGVIAPILWGALYQMIPVVAGTPVRAARWAPIVAASLALGGLSLTSGLALPWGPGVRIGQSLLTFAALAFGVPVADALWRAPARTPTVDGLRVAFGTLGLVVVSGLWLAWPWGGGAYSVHRPEARWMHGAIALLGWVGGSSMAISWQLAPMFWLAKPLPSTVTRRLLLALVGAVVLAVVAALVAAPLGGWAVTGLVPLAALVWGLHPWWTASSLAAARRPVRDGARDAWIASLACAPLAGSLSVLAWSSHEPRWAVVAGVVALWGWALTLVFGTLARIVPFLVWFHRFSARVGLADVPSMKDLLPDRWVRAFLLLHGANGLGLLALVWAGGRPGAALVGVGVGAEGVALGLGLGWVLSRR